MQILFLLIPLSLLLLGLAVWGFFWMVRNDQFDDLDAAARLALDDPPPAPTDDDAGQALK